VLLRYEHISESRNGFQTILKQFSFKKKTLKLFSTFWKIKLALIVSAYFGIQDHTACLRFAPKRCNLSL